MQVATMLLGQLNIPVTFLFTVFLATFLYSIWRGGVQN